MYLSLSGLRCPVAVHFVRDNSHFIPLNVGKDGLIDSCLASAGGALFRGRDRLTI